MALRFNLYYFSQNTGEYLEKTVGANPQRLIAHSILLSRDFPDPAAAEADVHFIEYQAQASGLDQWIESIRPRHGQTAVFLYLSEADTATLLQALRLGVQECFVGTVPEEDFQKALNRLLRTRVANHAVEKSQVIALLGCKGGAGATFIAVNLAQTLINHRQDSVLLIDLDLRAGNVSSFLDIQPRYTILDVIENFERLDPQYLQDIVHNIESGIHVLPAPIRLEDCELVQVIHVEKILSYIRKQNLYRWLILDLGDVLDELTLKALELSDLILLISLLSIPGLRDTKKIYELFQLLEFPEDKIRLVGNAYNKHSDIKPAEAKKFLGQEFCTILPYDHTSVVQSINEGQPLVKTQPRHRLSQDFLALANSLTPEEEDPVHRSGSWTAFKRLLRLRK